MEKHRAEKRRVEFYAPVLREETESDLTTISSCDKGAKGITALDRGDYLSDATRDLGDDDVANTRLLHSR